MKKPEQPAKTKVYTCDEIEDLAFEGAELPQDLNYGETLLFLMFRALYEYARSTHMNSDQGIREKQRILFQCKRYLLDADYAKYAAERTLRMEQAMRDYRKAQSPEEALRAANKLVEAIDNVPVKKPW